MGLSRKAVYVWLFGGIVSLTPSHTRASLDHIPGLIHTLKLTPWSLSAFPAQKKIPYTHCRLFPHAYKGGGYHLKASPWKGGYQGLSAHERLASVLFCWTEGQSPNTAIKIPVYVDSWQFKGLSLAWGLVSLHLPLNSLPGKTLGALWRRPWGSIHSALGLGWYSFGRFWHLSRAPIHPWVGVLLGWGSVSLRPRHLQPWELFCNTSTKTHVLYDPFWLHYDAKEKETTETILFFKYSDYGFVWLTS